MKTHYRIIRRTGMYIIQRKSLFFWHTLGADHHHTYAEERMYAIHAREKAERDRRAAERKQRGVVAEYELD